MVDDLRKQSAAFQLVLEASLSALVTVREWRSATFGSNFFVELGKLIVQNQSGPSIDFISPAGRRSGRNI
jgi:hypothetical protein